MGSAAEPDHDVLAWAVEDYALPNDRIKAAEKYLKAGGGQGVCPAKYGFSHNVFKVKGRTIIGYQGDFDVAERDYKTELKRVPNNKIFTDETHGAGIHSEIGRVIAALLKPMSDPADNIEDRLLWLEMILRSARPEVLAQVEWHLLVCWMCQRFDNRSNTTSRLFDLFKKYVRKGTIPKGAWFSPSNDMAAKLGLDPDGSSGSMASHEPFHLSWATGGEFSSAYLGDFCLRNKTTDDWLPSFRMERFAKRMLDEWKFVENSTIFFVIRWSRMLIREGIEKKPHKRFDDLLRMLCKAYAESNLSQPEDMAKWLGGTILPFACKEDNLRAVEVLLELGADVNARRSPGGKTALMHASHHGIFELLLYHKDADLKQYTAPELSAVLCAAIASGLARRQFWMNGWDRPPYQSLVAEDEHMYVEEGDILKQVRYIIDHSDPNVVNTPSRPMGASWRQTGILPIHLAMGGRVLDGKAKPWSAAIELLLTAGADPNVQFDFLGYSKKETGVDQRTSFKTWPLHHAVREMQVHRQSIWKSLVDTLLDHGARPDNKDALGRTACDLENARLYPRLAMADKSDDKSREE